MAITDRKSGSASGTSTSNRLGGVPEGIAVKAPVRVATTANITLNGLQTIDGVSLAADDRVLVKDQTAGTENGIYVAASGNWARAGDFSVNGDIVEGTRVYVNQGSTNANTEWAVTTDDDITIDTSSIAWTNVTLAAVPGILASQAEAEAGELNTKVMSPLRTAQELAGGQLPASVTSLAASTTFKLTGIVTPSQITANQNDYSPTGLSTATVLRLSTDATRNIMGLATGASGRILIIHNVGSFNVALKDESASSAAANRFALQSDITLVPDGVAVLQYDATSSRWRAVSGGGGDLVFAEDYGAIGDGVTNDAPAIQAAFDAGNKTVLLRFKTYLVNSTITVPANGTLMSLERGSLKKGANGDMINLGANYAALRGIYLLGQGGSFTGRGVIIGAGDNQEIAGCDITGMSGYCLEFTAIDVGQNFLMHDCLVQRTALGDAIKLPGESPYTQGSTADSSTFGERSFMSVRCGGGRLIDLSGGNVTKIHDSNNIGITFRTGSRYAMITSCRIAGDVDVDGLGHHLANNTIGGNLTILSGVTDATVEIGALAGTFADNSGNSTNRLLGTNATAGNIFGLTLSNNAGDATNDIDIASGRATDRSSTIGISLSAITKRLDANWAVGTNQGMRDSSAAITNTTYHIYLVSKSTGLDADIYAHTSTTVATVITALQAETGGSSYTHARRIGSIVRTGGAIKAFTQNGDEFLWSVYATDASSVAPANTNAASVTLTLPVGIVIDALVLLRWDYVSGAGSILLSSLAVSDQAAGSAIQSAAAATTATVNSSPHRIRTNTSAQIRVRANTTGSTYSIATYGWIDTRDRLT